MWSNSWSCEKGIGILSFACPAEQAMWLKSRGFKLSLHWTFKFHRTLKQPLRSCNTECCKVKSTLKVKAEKHNHRSTRDFNLVSNLILAFLTKAWDLDSRDLAVFEMASCTRYYIKIKVAMNHPVAWCAQKHAVSGVRVKCSLKRHAIV